MKGMGVGESPATRQCLLQAAQGLFATRGYHGASIRVIVQACGVSNAALYYHFGSKKDLYFAVLGEYVAAAVARLRNADTGYSSLCRGCPAQKGQGVHCGPRRKARVTGTAAY